jgi:undecaprenyl diphosphate synthase
MEPSPSTLPRHVAVIMDGNGRWARDRGMPRIEGHRKGADSVKEIVRVSADAGIHYLTLYAFSVENWQRPKDEIDGLMEMLEHFLHDQTGELVKRRIRFRTIGRTDELPASVREQIERAKAATRSFDQWHLTLALNYGSRTEIVDAARQFAAAVAAGEIDPAHCGWCDFSRFLYTGDLPDPDLIIRTSGETRLSNFLMPQAAYAEIFFSPVLWPDFREKEYKRALEHYATRERRFGKTGEQLKCSPAASLVSP